MRDSFQMGSGLSKDHWLIGSVATDLACELLRRVEPELQTHVESQSKAFQILV